MDNNEVRCDEGLYADSDYENYHINHGHERKVRLYSLSWIVARHCIKVLDGQQLQCLSTPRQGKFGNLLPKSNPG